MIDKRELEIIEFIKKNQVVSSREIFEGFLTSISYAKRILSKLFDENLLTKKGQGKSTKYLISPNCQPLARPAKDLGIYFLLELRALGLFPLFQRCNLSYEPAKGK